ncbi:MAG TPA: type IV secretory system conjugative DNA transfer family protein [Rhizomicrobium sp.]|jgi:type IV secretion system protein VirD4|nr:type IV secretory system conjugative DNA transfer family protein [Rhizomicrobium sp.]
MFGTARSAILQSRSPWAPSLGRYLRGPEDFGDKLLYNGERNILLFGPNGSGKGTRFLMPNLLQMEDCSIVVIDPKGELAAVTAKYRATIGEVVIINPFGVLTGVEEYEDLESDGFNPLRGLNPASPYFNADASWLAEALVTVEGKDPHWDRSARKLVAGLIMWVRMKYGEDAHLGQVRELLTEPTIEAREGKAGEGIPYTAMAMMKSKLPALRQKAGQFVRTGGEVASIVSSADTQTEALDDAEIATDLRKPGIDFREMKKRPITVYLILLPDMMDRHARWLRMLISTALRGVLSPRQHGDKQVFYFLDEFAALGHLSIIETTWALVRGDGIQLVPVFQDINQLRALYQKRAETFIAQAGAVLAFGPNDLETADWMSRRAGERTELLKGYSQSLTEPLGQESMNYSQMKAPTLRGHDLFDTPDGHAYAWIANMANHVPVYVPAYYEIGECKKLARANPYYGG